MFLSRQKKKNIEYTACVEKMYICEQFRRFNPHNPLYSHLHNNESEKYFSVNVKSYYLHIGRKLYSVRTLNIHYSIGEFEQRIRICILEKNNGKLLLEINLCYREEDCNLCICIVFIYVILLFFYGYLLIKIFFKTESLAILSLICSLFYFSIRF